MSTARIGCAARTREKSRLEARGTQTLQDQLSNSKSGRFREFFSCILFPGEVEAKLK